MAGVIGSIGPFDESIDQLSSTTERLEYFRVTNGISDDKIVHFDFPPQVSGNH